MPQLLEAIDPRLTVVDADGALPGDFATDVRAGLTAAKKKLPCRYLYDAFGSALFEEICGLPEYYPTRTELAILRAHAADIVTSCSADAAIVELGSGSATKTRVLIEAALARKAPVRYVPIDI